MAYAQWIEINIVNKGEKPLTISIFEAELTHGKFYVKGDKNHEVPINQVDTIRIKHGTMVPIYSCGRNHAWRGTKGSIGLLNTDDNGVIGHFHWDCPWNTKINNFHFTKWPNGYIVKMSGGNTDSGAIGTVTLEVSKP